MTKFLVLGKTGQVASAFAEILPEACFIGSDELDLSAPEYVYKKLEELGITSEYIINSMAYTAVDKAEDEQELCDNINHKSAGEIAKFCADKNIKLIHYSTDYVFDGNGEKAFQEDNSENLEPLNFYGKTKLAGEKAIQNSGCEYLILRTSWVYSATGNNFVKTMLKLAENRDELSIVSDQIGSPSYALDIATNTLKLLDQNGVYHFVPSEKISWYDFAKMIFEITGIEMNLKSIPTSNYPTPAKRPLNSRLDSSKTQALGIKFPPIRESLQDCLKRLS